MPDVGHRQRDVLGERAVASDPEADRVGAQVAAAGQAVAAAAADHVTLTANEVAGAEVDDIAAHVDDLAGRFLEALRAQLVAYGAQASPAVDDATSGIWTNSIS